MALKSLQKTAGPSIAFVVAKDFDNEEASKEDDDEDEVAFLIRRINKVWTNKTKVRSNLSRKKKRKPRKVTQARKSWCAMNVKNLVT